MERVLGGFAEVGDGHEAEGGGRNIEVIVEYELVSNNCPDAEGVYGDPLETADRTGRVLAWLKEVVFAV
jgi:hypothetical protein